MEQANRNSSSTYVRSFVFGVEDSLVSTVGLLSGVAITGMSAKTIFITGIVLIFVEAFSMGAGSFLAEHSVNDFESKTIASERKSIASGFIMFISYFISGFIPLFPYIIIQPKQAFPISIIASLIALFLLGTASAKISGVSMLRSSFRMFIVGGTAIGVGITAGSIAANL